MTSRVFAFLLFAFLLLCSGPLALVVAEVDEDSESGLGAGEEKTFEEDLQDAIEQQEFREEVDVEVISQIVDVAPEVELSNGDGDVSTTNNCTVDIDVFCTDITPGEGRLAKCLKEQLAEERLGNSQGRSVSEACKFELKSFEYLRATNINLNIPYAKACASDIAEHCEDVTEDDGEDATILIQNCLRKKKYQIGTSCRKELTTVLLDQAKDYKLNMELFYSCNDDVERHCKAMLGKGEGEVQSCLMKKRRSLEWECEEALLKNIADNADDLRLLSYKIYKTCLPDKKKFCKEIEFGNARTQACLESKIYEPGFSQQCRKELLFLQEQRTTQWQWDSNLKKECKREIPELCGYSDDEFGDAFDDEDDVSLDDATVLNCLVDYREEITSEGCKAQVEKKIVNGAKNIRLNRRAFEACFEDQDKYCRKIKPGEGLVYDCLRKEGEKNNLSEACKKELFEEAKLESESVDRNPLILKKCKNLIKTKCKDVSKGEGRVLDCLVNNMRAPESTQSCKQTLHDYLVVHMKDYRLDYGLSHACKSDVSRLCGPDQVACQPDSEVECQGEVYNCLIGNVTTLTSACKTQVKEAVALHALNVRYDPQLFHDCQEDITSLCLVEFGRNDPYAVHDCLFRNVNQLQKKCKRQEFRLEAVKLRDVEMMPHIKKDCPSEMASYCKDVPHGNGQKWACLSHYAMVKPFSPDCMRSMYLHTKRIAQSKGVEPDVFAGCKREIKMCKRHAPKSKDQSQATPLMKCLSDGVSSGGLKFAGEAKENGKGDSGGAAKVSALCEKSVAKVTRQAFYFYFEKNTLVQACDGDIRKHCEEYKAVEDFEYSPGSVLKCLAEKGSEALSQDCVSHVNVGLLGDTTTEAGAPKIHLTPSSGNGNGNGDSSSQQQQQQQREVVRVRDETVQQSGIVISGSLAVLCIGSLVLVVLGVAFFVYRQYYKPSHRNPYTLVMKQGDV